jgi:hypothetical protein
MALGRFEGDGCQWQLDFVGGDWWWKALMLGGQRVLNTWAPFDVALDARVAVEQKAQHLWYSGPSYSSHLALASG